MVIVITQLHTTFMVLLAIVPFFMIPVFADVEVEGVSGFYGHDDAYNVIGVVKNSGNYSALAAVTIQLEYGNTVVETTVYTHNIKANGEIPFKIPLYDTDGEIPKFKDPDTTTVMRAINPRSTSACTGTATKPSLAYSGKNITLLS